ncbi:MAG: bifunctional folylpolyglutamate synthase/dihydrofolate synthase [Chloroflexi bacterium]|nr:bifunctional folylpolyglutamate synthase/dihydrofolate synthase [Chloroflexota bacterium]
MSDAPTTRLEPVEVEARLDYDSALRKVMGLADFERSTHSPGHSAFHIERMSLLMERLGNCHLDIPTVHVAGTKGKGSTAAMVTSILTAEGYTVGLYTSPHLHSAVERIRVGLTPVAKGSFASLVEQVWPDVEWVGKEGGLGAVTTFEMLTAMAFLHFKQVGADFQVMEVGLGGRLDSTNIVTPAVSIITSISLDHVATLGGTLELIAREKAGIIKPGAPVVVAPQRDEAMAVFREVAAEKSAPLISVADNMSWEKGEANLDGQTFAVEGAHGRYELATRLLGDTQIENASTAVAAIESLVDSGFAVSDESVVRGVRDVRWPARLETLSREAPVLVVDGAHNPYSMKRLVESVRQYFDFDRVFVVFGALGGHSGRGMLAELAALGPTIIPVRSRHPRSAPSALMAAVASDLGLRVVGETASVAHGTRRALELAGDGDLVLGTGSLSVAAEVIEEIRGIEPELYPYIKRPADTGAMSAV